MGLNPAFILTANSKDVTGTVADRLSSLTLTTETEHQSDELSLALWNTDPNYPLKKPPVGAVLTLALGYEGDLHRMGSFVVSSLSGRGGKGQGRVMEIRARSVPYSETPDGVSGFQTQKTRSWRKGTTIGAMVQKMAADHGMTAGVSAALAGIHLQHFDQTDESDISFLQKVAKSYDAVAKPSGGKLLFLNRGDAESASGKEIPPVSLTTTQVSEWSWSEDRHIAPGTVVALYHATRQAKNYAVSIGSGEPVRRIKRKFRTVDDARSAAQAEMGRRARGSMDLSLTLPGDASLNAGSALLLDDSFDEGVAGRWIVKRGIHRLDKGEGFVTELSCERPNDDTTVQGLMNGPVKVDEL
ncbi:contractile injection system protein, VgrG/Pvc8 family [Bombella pollinis]|uniref:Contractile injection system protein, VgrG/Pvc8 family n=1 Tax=Bombella pollinis TaxID=2967337 RepID=A0ABT3WLC4_9PROT|nr:contractile injection system protein, VgrG/Pvc8 family [Bombella pollinis]MCX5619925.1 contractile injection system protein, VgrG/Pvc8 family [Bombella pollinis]